MPVDFGSAFGPVTPPQPTADERRHQELVDGLLGIQMTQEHVVTLLQAVLEQEHAAPVIEVPGGGTDLSPLVEALSRPYPIPASPEAVAEALARRLPDYGEMLAAVSAGLAATAQQLEKMNKKVTAMSVMPSGGASGHVIVDSGTVNLGSGSEIPVTNLAGIGHTTDEEAPAGDGTGVALLKNLRRRIAVIEAKDFATEATLAALRAIATDLHTEARRRRLHRLATGLATVPAGATYTTIVEFTTAVPVTILGYNADFQSVATANYRMRFITGSDEAPDIWHGEEVSTGANSWQPVVFDIAAGTRVAVQVVHDQLTAQSVRGSINYYEEP